MNLCGYAIYGCRLVSIKLYKLMINSSFPKVEL